MRFKLLIALVMGALALAGCSSQHPNVKEMGKVKNIEVERVQKSRQKGFLVAKAELVNSSSSNQHINYRFEWLDDQGFPVGTEETWKSKLIYGGQTTYVNSTAPVTQAVDFRIELQESR